MRQQTRGWDCAVGGPGRGGRRGGGGANIRTLFNGKIRSRSIVSRVTETEENTHLDTTRHAETRAEGARGAVDRSGLRHVAHAATTSFTHHLRLISLAAVIGAAHPVAIWAKSRKSHLLSGAPLAGLLPVVM